MKKINTGDVDFRNHNLLESTDQDPGVWEGGLVARNFSENIIDLHF
jgi:hypothetical protein